MGFITDLTLKLKTAKDKKYAPRLRTVIKYLHVLTKCKSKLLETQDG